MSSVRVAVEQAAATDAISAFDLDAYLRRIGYRGERALTRDVLGQLHLAHVTHIPFENLDIQLGLPIRLDLESLQNKLVRDKRGGYCFEQNTLFAAALECLGFPVTRLAARVRIGANRVAPRTHMLLKVEAEAESLIADVGFGGEGLLYPVPLKPGEPSRQHAWSYRLVPEASQWVLQSLHGESWQDLYAFTLEPAYPVDFEVANHFTATYPDSHFVKTLTVQLPTPEARYILRNQQLTVEREGIVSQRIVDDIAALIRVCSEIFGIDIPAGHRFRSLEFRPE